MFMFKSDFSRGEIEPKLLARVGADYLQAACRRLANWWVDRLGAVVRRPPTVSLPPDRLDRFLFDYNGESGEMVVDDVMEVLFEFRGQRYRISLLLGEVDGLTTPNGTVQPAPALVMRGGPAGLANLDSGSGSSGVPGSWDFLEVIWLLDDLAEVTDAPLSEQVSWTQFGPTLFFVSALFFPRRVFVQLEDTNIHDEGELRYEVPAFFEEVIGQVKATRDSNAWEGVPDTNTVFLSQLRPGNTIRFDGEQYTVDTITDENNFTTQETYLGPTLRGKLARRVTLEGQELTGETAGVVSSPAGPLGGWNIQVNGTGTDFQNELVVGDVIRIRYRTMTVTDIASATELTAKASAPLTAGSGFSIFLIEGELFTGSLPQLVESHKGRLVLAASADRPTTIWASAPGDPFLLFGYSVEDDSPIEIELMEQGFDRILWIASRERLYIGTGRGEFAVGSENAPLTPATFIPRRVGSEGSGSPSVATSGQSVVHLSPDRKQVKVLQYKWDTQSFQSFDLTGLASHLFEAPVRQLVYRPSVANDRTARIFALLESGELRVCAADESTGAVAWSRLEIGDPHLSIVGLAADAENVLLVAKREVPAGGGADAQEHLVPLLVDTRMAGAPFLMDEIVRYEVVQDGWVIVDTPYRAGWIGVVNEAGEFLGDFEETSSAGVQAAVEVPGLLVGDIVYYGRVYPPGVEIELPPPSTQDQRGVRMGRLQRLVRVVVGLQDTRQLLVNNTPLLGQTGWQASQELSPQTGFFEKRFLGWTRDPRLTFSGASVYPAAITVIQQEYNQ